MRSNKLFLIALAVFTTACADATRPVATPGDESFAHALDAEPTLAQGGATFWVSAVELDAIFDDPLGSAAVTHATGPRTYALLYRREVRSLVGVTW